MISRLPLVSKPPVYKYLVCGICYWTKFRVLVLTYKAQYSSGPLSSRDHLVPYITSWLLCSAGNDHLEVPKTPEACFAVIQSRAFRTTAPVLWDSMVAKVQQRPTVCTFWKQLKMKWSLPNSISQSSSPSLSHPLIHSLTH